jgi:hypothetical protein
MPCSWRTISPGEAKYAEWYERVHEGRLLTLPILSMGNGTGICIGTARCPRR